MWWKPRNRDEEIVRGYLDRIDAERGDLRDPRGALVLGTGVAFSPQGPRPLVVCRDLDFEERAGGEPGIGSGRDPRRPQPPPRRRGMALLDLEQLEQQHPRTGRRLSRTLFREQRGVFMVVRAVSAHFGSGSRVRDSATRASGTLGVALARGASSGPNAILSAGHVFPGGVGSTAETPSYLGPFPINSQPIGSVAYHWSPSQLPVPEFDVAVIDLIAPGPIAPLAHAGVAQLPNSLAWPLTGTIHAHGRTLNNVAIMGALTSLTPPAGAPAWRDVWIAGPSGVTRHGDSGAPFVLATTGEVAGCVVGAALGPGSTGAWCDLIQDMRQIEVHCLTPHGYRVT